MIAQLLIIAGGIPLCATATGFIVWLLYRNESLEDPQLQRNFLVVFAILLCVGWAVLRTDAVRMKMDPGFRIKTEIEANTLFKTINEIDESGTGRTLRQSLEQRMIAGASLTEALARSRPLLSEAARYRLGFADQQTRIMWARYVADTLEELQQDPDSCYLVVSGDTLDEGGDALSADNTEAFHAVLIRLYESSDMTMRRVHSPTDVPTDLDAAGREFRSIEKDLTSEYGPEVADALSSRKFENPPAPAETMCRARIFQLEEILKRPQGTAATLVGNALR